MVQAETHVRVRYFAVLREGRGCEEEQVAVSPEETVKMLYARLFPAGPEGVLPVLYAVNQVYVRGDYALKAGDEVAFVPPLGGG